MCEDERQGSGDEFLLGFSIRVGEQDVATVNESNTKIVRI